MGRRAHRDEGCGQCKDGNCSRKTRYRGGWFHDHLVALARDLGAEFGLCIAVATVILGHCDLVDDRRLELNGVSTTSRRCDHRTLRLNESSKDPVLDARAPGAEGNVDHLAAGANRQKLDSSSLVQDRLSRLHSVVVRVGVLGNTLDPGLESEHLLALVARDELTFFCVQPPVETGNVADAQTGQGRVETSERGRGFLTAPTPLSRSKQRQGGLTPQSSWPRWFDAGLALNPRMR